MRGRGYKARSGNCWNACIASYTTPVPQTPQEIEQTQVHETPEEPTLEALSEDTILDDPRLEAAEPRDVPHVQPCPTDLGEASRYYTNVGFALFPVKLTTMTKDDGSVKLDKKPLCLWRTMSDTDPDFIAALLKSRQ